MILDTLHLFRGRALARRASAQGAVCAPGGHHRLLVRDAAKDALEFRDPAPIARNPHLAALDRIDQ